jgi:hypothetical protein
MAAFPWWHSFSDFVAKVGSTIRSSKWQTPSRHHSGSWALHRRPRSQLRGLTMAAPASELEAEIAHVRDLGLGGLRARWHSVFRRKAPDHLPRHLLYASSPIACRRSGWGIWTATPRAFSTGSPRKPGVETNSSWGAASPPSSPEPFWCASGTENSSAS